MKVKEAALLFNVQQARLTQTLLADHQQHVAGEEFEDPADRKRAEDEYTARANYAIDEFLNRYALNYLMWHLLRVKEAGESVKLTMARSGDQAWRSFVRRLESGLAKQHVGADDFKNHVKARCSIDL